jgi:hypothetical protein
MISRCRYIGRTCHIHIKHVRQYIIYVLKDFKTRFERIIPWFFLRVFAAELCQIAAAEAAHGRQDQYMSPYITGEHIIYPRIEGQSDKFKGAVYYFKESI